MRSKALQTILVAGLIAGTLDITAAFLLSALRATNPHNPIWVLQSVASGLLGADSFTGGFASAALGAACHYLIALTAAAVFYAASRKLTFLVQQPVVSGLLYGIVVYSVMNFVVLPLSAVPFKLSYPPAVLLRGSLVIMICVGLPIALVVRRAARPS